MGLVGARAPDVDELGDRRSARHPRNGYQVEVNALWYNAVRYTLRLAGEHGDKKFVKAWESLPERTAAAFNELFRLPEGYLADCIGCEGTSKEIRPNMILACGLPYKMIDEQTQLEVIRTVSQHLLTPKRGCGRSRPQPALQGFAGRVRPPNATSPARTARYGRGCCRSTCGPASMSTAIRSCRRPKRCWPTSGRTSRPTASVRSERLFDADPRSHPRSHFAGVSVAAVLDIYGMIRRRRRKRSPRKEEKAVKKPAAKSAKAGKKRRQKASAAKAAKPAAKKKRPPRDKTASCRQEVSATAGIQESRTCKHGREP